MVERGIMVLGSTTNPRASHMKGKEVNMAFEQPDIRPTGPGEYTLHGNYTYTDRTTVGHPLSLIKVPDGFKYDGASVPRPLWSISGIRPDGLIRAAALIHDFIYRYAGWKGRYTRKEADILFRYIIREAGLGWWTAVRAYRAVRLFGWIPWRKNSK